LPRAKTAERGSIIAMGYFLVGHSELKAYQKREFLRMRHGNSSFLGEKCDSLSKAILFVLSATKVDSTYPGPGLGTATTSASLLYY